MFHIQVWELFSGEETNLSILVHGTGVFAGKILIESNATKHPQILPYKITVVPGYLQYPVQKTFLLVGMASLLVLLAVAMCLYKFRSRYTSVTI